MFLIAVTCFLFAQDPLHILEEISSKNGQVNQTEVQNIVIFEGSSFFDLSPEMERFLNEHVTNKVTEFDKLKALLHTIFDKDKLNMEYSNFRTMPPKETFAERTGNCLSFTGMFIAMARYCGLYANFQEVSDLSSWTQKGKFTIYNRHMNAIVFIDGRRMSIDFNYQANKEFRVVHHATDVRGIAHFYNNLGAENLSNENYSLARRYFEAAIEIDSSFAQGWTNMGVLERVIGHFEAAEQCYIKASELNRFDYTPKMNLALLYALQGKKKKSEKLMHQVRRYRARNPYYHYDLGRTALDEFRYNDAVSHFKRAVRMHKTNPRFLVGLAAAYQKVGKLQKARKLVLKARDLVDTYEEKYLYDLKLQSLYAGR